MKAKFFYILMIVFLGFTAAKAQDPAIAGINPGKSPIMIGETTIIEADILNGSSAPILKQNNATWTINLPPNIEVQSITFDDPTVLNFLTVYQGAYDPVEGTTIQIVSDKANFPGGTASTGAYIAYIGVIGRILTAVGIPAPMSINAASFPPVGTNNSGNDNATSSISVIAALPVTLVSFTVAKENKTAVLNWATTAETNSDRFEIERSLSGKDWNKIGTVASHGESSVKVNYSFTDTKPANGENLYRLKMIDRDATYAYSRIQSVKFDGLKGAAVSIYPNPSTDKVFIQDMDLTQVTQVSILDMNGRAVFSSSTVNSDGINVSKLIPGTYILHVAGKNGSVSNHKIVIIR